jgi:hypothetical protein
MTVHERPLLDTEARSVLVKILHQVPEFLLVEAQAQWVAKLLGRKQPVFNSC